MTRPDETETIEISSEMIRLGQLLKFADVVESGAQAGELVASGDVQVDGEVETRRGRQLRAGSVVTIALPQGRRALRVAVGPGDDADIDVPW